MTVVRRYEFTDEDWAQIEPLLPKQERGGKWNDHRTVMNGMFWVLRSGAFWSDLPERYGPPTTIYNRFNRWRKAGVWDRLMDEITRLYDGDVQMIDTSIVRVHQHGATAKRGVEIDVWVVPEAVSPRKSMRLSTGMADPSSSNSRQARKATSKQPRS